ncbi:STAS domain-containing protein [Actinomadura sp. HBU206391]|uniref:STAS domain-containing protein n=1 Tax=Actinomadura sp. HBU206391 TaxID=2731692 RepID=UPI00164F45AA|nr:STAS domain-containing protein [Actinomadura sp. HBU206391]MBC6457241.1 STAS domain-containing protein [Actinomadura sp. HBU206391]
MEVLRLSIRTYNGTATVTVAGELDIATEPDLRSYMERVLLGRHERIILDVSAVSFIGATGLGALVAVQRHARRRNTQMLLAGVHPSMFRLMEITKLDDYFVLL